VDIAAMLLWIVTAGAGVYLLASGRPVRAASLGGEAAEAPDRATVPPSRPVQAGIPQAAIDALAAGARVPPIARTRVTTQPGQHPLLEFMHPALAIIGLGCWTAYVVTKFPTFAWVSFGVLVATIAAGLTWYTVNRRLSAARSATAGAASGVPAPGGAARRYPPRRILAHGSAAGLTLILALVTLLISVHS
jgi:hypothetical protein